MGGGLKIMVDTVCSYENGNYPRNIFWPNVTCRNLLHGAFLGIHLVEALLFSYIWIKLTEVPLYFFGIWDVHSAGNRYCGVDGVGTCMSVLIHFVMGKYSNWKPKLI